MRRLATVEGIEDLRSDGDNGKSEIQVKVDSDQAGRFGIAPGTIAQILSLTYRGVQLPRLHTGDKEIDLVVSLLPEDQESIENLSLLTVGSVDGRPIQLTQVVDLEFGKSPDRISRQDQRTGVTITGTWSGDKLSEGLDLVRPVMDGLDLPFGYGWNFGSQILRSRQQQTEMTNFAKS